MKSKAKIFLILLALGVLVAGCSETAKAIAGTMPQWKAFGTR